MSETNSLQAFTWAGHSHVCRERGEGGCSLADWAREFRARGLNYFGFGHPWETWDLEWIREWELNEDKARAYHQGGAREGTNAEFWTRASRFDIWRQQYSTEDFLFGVDLETPKIRYGHLWWVGWQPENLAPWHDYDKPWTSWECSEARDAGAPPPPFERRYPAEAIRVQHAAGAIPVYAHPTSWWFDAKGRHVTNIAATLVPDLLSGQACGALVVMGYDADQLSYQRLWLDLLDRGFFMTGVAETDACLDESDPFAKHGLLHNHAFVRSRDLEGLKEALRLGRNVMSSGPALDLCCGVARVGDCVAENGGEIRVTAGKLDPVLPYRLELRNSAGALRAWDFSGQEEISFTHTHSGKGWMVAKLTSPGHPRVAALTNPLFFGISPQRVTAGKLPDPLRPWWKTAGAVETLEYLAAGHWRKDFPGREPGNVPPEAFQWDRWRGILERM